MRVVIQRVNRASVTVDGQVTGSIELGLCLLVGITHEDTREDIQYIVDKTLNMRIFPDQTGDSGFDESVMDVNGGLLLVSQFTLYASTRKGRRPGFTDAARPEQAQPMFDELVDTFRINSGLSVETGVFGASMTVDIENAGPMTITLDSAERSAPRKG
jgi:D-tyrosyl-tRNA(Tyr) deacylase